MNKEKLESIDEERPGSSETTEEEKAEPQKEKQTKSSLLRRFLMFLFIPVKWLLKSILKIVLIIGVLYLVLHYVDVYSYLEKDRLPPPLQVVIDYSISTPPGEAVMDAFFLLIPNHIPSIDLNLFGGVNTLTVNTNPDSNIGAVVDFDDGSGIVVYTTIFQGKERINKIVGLSKKDDVATIDIDPATLLPIKSEFEDYIYTYHRFTNIGVDVSVTDPNGSISEVETVLFEEELASGNFLFPTANAGVITKGVTWAAKNIQKYVGKKAAAGTLNSLDFDENMDFAMWAEYIGKIETISTCAVGLVTMVIPNPASALAVTVGCGSYIAETVPQYSSIAPDICDSKDAYTSSCLDAVIKFATKGMDKGDFYLKGSVKPDSYLSNGFDGGAILKFTHKGGTVIDIATPKRFGMCRLIEKKVGAFMELSKEPDCNQGRILKQGLHDVVVSAKGYVSKNFAIAISDDRILIKEGEKTVFDEKREGSYSQKMWNIRLVEVEEEEVSEDKSPEPDKSAYDGTWKGTTKTTSIERSDYAEECEGEFPFTLDIKYGKVTGKPDIKIKYDVLSVTGKIDDTGKMTGKLKAIKVITLADFDVEFKGFNGTGTWNSDRFKCSGVMTLRKN